MTPKKAAQIIDRIGRLRAEAAEINDEIDELKAKLVAADIKQGHGELFEVKMITTNRKVIDWKKIQEEFELPVEDYTTITESTSMRISARKKG